MRNEEIHAGLKIGGLLYLLAIGIVLAPIRMIIFTIVTFAPVILDGTIVSLFVSGENYNPMLGILLVVEIIVNTFLILAFIFLAVVFFRRSRYFPPLYVFLFIFNLLFIIIDQILVYAILPDLDFDPTIYREAGIMLVVGSLWSTYLFVSKRAKNTFVN
ncbi:MAG: DUF2569 domain-containing protein [Sumerlaeia bacterium]